MTKMGILCAFPERGPEQASKVPDLLQWLWRFLVQPDQAVPTPTSLRVLKGGRGKSKRRASPKSGNCASGRGEKGPGGTDPDVT
jgi:hypothetical protein